MRVPRLGGALFAPVLLLLAGVAGCTPLPGEPAAANQPADVVSDLATLLTGAAKLTYSADYQVAGGAAASIAQAQGPRRMVLRFPGGLLLLTPQGITDCTTKARRTACTRRAGSPSTTVDGADPLAGVRLRGMVPPETVVRLLTAAATDPDALTEQSDTTIAGEHAGCVKVAQPAGEFAACVTTDGILGSFTGRVNGAGVDATLTRLRGTVDRAAFDLPRGATVVTR